MRQKMQKRMTPNMFMYLRQEAELQILDHQFRTRVNNAARNITTMQQNQTNVVNKNTNIEMDQLSCAPYDEEPPDFGKMSIGIEFRSGLDSECCTLSSAR